jgi:hypothetical protein
MIVANKKRIASLFNGYPLTWIRQAWIWQEKMLLNKQLSEGVCAQFVFSRSVSR